MERAFARCPTIVVERFGGAKKCVDILRSKGLVDGEARCIDGALFRRCHAVVAAGVTIWVSLGRNAFIDCSVELGDAYIELTEPGWGSLIYRGSVPEVMVTAAVGRHLEEIFDHGWLVGSDLEIVRSITYEGRWKAEFAAPSVVLDC